ncbi:hypothetical protein P4S63_25275 [Pseudoalteromonas sp. B193]
MALSLFRQLWFAEKDLTQLSVSNITLSKDKKSIDIELPLMADKIVQIDFAGLKDINGRSVSVESLLHIK